MKNSAFPLFTAVLILLVACNRIDNAFVEQIQTGLNKAQENKTAFEASVQQCTALFEKMSKAPEGMKNNPKFGYVEQLTRVSQLQQAYSSMIISQDEMAARAQTLLDEYTDSNVKKDSITQEITGILANFDGYQERLGRMNSMIEEAGKGFDQAMASWDATPEAEKAASAAMPPPVLPDVLAGRASRLLGTGPQPGAATSGSTTPGAAGSNTTPGALAPVGTAPQPTTGGTGTLSAPKKDGQKQ